MYGLLLESINEYIKEAYGESVWKLIRERALCPHHSFVTHQVYGEHEIPKIARAAAEVTGVDLPDLMDAFGVTFVSFVGQYGYDRILRVLGRHVRDFLNGLDNLHEYLRFSYPKLQPPSFFCEEESSMGLTLHYRSRRRGFVHYVKGQLRQVGFLFYQTEINVEVIRETDHVHAEGLTHVIFRLHFNNKAFRINRHHLGNACTDNLLPVRSDVFFEVFPFNVVFGEDMLIKRVGIGLQNIFEKLEGRRIDESFTLNRPLVKFTWSNVLNHTNNLFELVSRLPIERTGLHGRNSMGDEGSGNLMHNKVHAHKQATRRRCPWYGLGVPSIENGYGNGEEEVGNGGKAVPLDTSLELMAFQTVTGDALEGFNTLANENDRCLTLKGQMMFMEDWKSVIFIGTPIMENLEQMFMTGLYINDLSMHDSSRDLVLAGTQQSAELKLALDQEQQKSSKLEESMRMLDVEMKKTDELLYQMIPKAVADRLRKGEASVETCESHAAYFQVFQEVTILFSDVVGFTKICSRITPMQVVSMLNSMYTLFDQLTEKHNVYKVETIGDAYMVVSGAPEKTRFHAHYVADMALDMLRSMKHLQDPSTGDTLQIRIGIHSGAIVAGVVGITMPRYTVFGKDVTNASIIEKTGKGMHIHISETTKAHLDEEPYVIVERGTVTIKGKGEMKTYWLKEKSGDEPVETLDAPFLTNSSENESDDGSRDSSRISTYNPVFSDDVIKKHQDAPTIAIEEEDAPEKDPSQRGKVEGTKVKTSAAAQETKAEKKEENQKPARHRSNICSLL
ncbi:PREDICTED: soluble guanylate cyclase 88E-like isoform X2 [Branchiostoma belcheri]|uniref:guanylate cyclase n=1 Tax=Branchiostoma belcheri TaxID=7741 RepID=A0A6P4ZFJ0_BRABE|nr:PREDICTED: soluble guanylate cyclase 88E-like isoform X2 [Branchiostoma belcheri]